MKIWKSIMIRFRFANKNLKNNLKQYLTNKGIRSKINKDVVFTDKKNISIKNFITIYFTDKVNETYCDYTIALPEKRQIIIKKLKNYLF